MATTRRTSADREVDYPTSDGRPMAETEVHMRILIDLIQILQEHFAADPWVYVSGNLLLYYFDRNRFNDGTPVQRVSFDGRRGGDFPVTLCRW